jgi:hypothetical protein
MFESKRNGGSRKSRGQITMDSMMPLYKLASCAPSDLRIDKQKLSSFYTKYGEFPSHYRPLVWRYLLRLPENTTEFKELAQRGIHTSFVNLEEKFPLKNERLLSKLRQLCSMLAHWAPIFAEVILIVINSLRLILYQCR